jgi:hypothetical protein
MRWIIPPRFNWSQAHADTLPPNGAGVKAWRQPAAHEFCLQRQPHAILFWPFALILNKEPR